mmetsp:Transcript_49642/g.138960  ORF Transcript_49642/g.138960 Transcript_49642/m.138960 type:complete len:216 (-) Transcript_49642:78-725(-)
MARDIFVARPNTSDATAAHKGSAVEGWKRAVFLHDIFNLVFVLPIIVLTCVSLLWPSRYSHGFLSMFTFFYVALDTVYSWWIPQLHPSSFRWATVMVHHFTTLLLLLHPILCQEHGYFTAYCTIVELNTAFLTLQRMLRWRSMQVGFYVTWVGMRLIWYPYLLYLFASTVAADPVQTRFQVIGSQAVLCALNFVWTAEVVYGLTVPREHTKKKAS